MKKDVINTRKPRKSGMIWGFFTGLFGFIGLAWTDAKDTKEYSIGVFIGMLISGLFWTIIYWAVAVWILATQGF